MGYAHGGGFEMWPQHPLAMLHVIGNGDGGLVGERIDDIIWLDYSAKTLVVCSCTNTNMVLS